MAFQITTRQHFVPRTYLKHFSNKVGAGHYNISVLPINDLKEDKIIERNTKSICYENNLYTQEGSTAEEKMLLETFYSDALENKYEGVYEILTNPNKETLSTEERELVISTVSTMYYRVPIWIKKHNEIMERVFAMCIQASENTGKPDTTIGGFKYVIKGKTVSQLMDEYEINNKSNHVIQQLKVAIDLIRIRLENNNVYIFKLEDGDQEFITSDNPVKLQNFNSDDIMPFDPTNIMKLPLDKKHYLMLMPNEKKENLNRIVRNFAKGGFSKREELISNTEQFQGASEYILGSDSSLKRFIKIKDQNVVMTKEEQELDNNLFSMLKKNNKTE